MVSGSDPADPAQALAQDDERATAPLSAPLSAQLTVAVRVLCEFAAKGGDLDLRFTPGPSAMEGIEGHGIVAARRGPGYRRELRLEGQFGELRLVGRADGYDPGACRLEEVKTHRGDIHAMPANQRALHWAQAMCYGAMLCRLEGLAQLQLALVYFDIGTRGETAIEASFTRDELDTRVNELCARYTAWALHEQSHRQQRDAALRTLPFAHPQFRGGQRSVAEHAYRAARLGRPLMVQAPTGIGKTIGTIYPMLKAAPTEQFDKIVFLTAKTSGRAPALTAVEQLRRASPDLPLRVVELLAREKACVHPDKACHGDSCPLAKGFFDRLPQARSAAVAVLAEGSAQTGSPSSLVAEVAAQNEICPYYLNQELVRWADVIVADYNHWFDRSALVHALTVEHGWRVALLVDEAHNLIERARQMYSSSLSWAALGRARKTAPPRLKRGLDRIARAWAALGPSPEVYAEVDLPERFVRALSRSLSEWSEAWAAAPTAMDPDVLSFYFDVLGFEGLAASFGEHSIADLSAQDDAKAAKNHRPTLSIRNVVPAAYVSKRLEAAHTAVLFSATLAPIHYYLDMLGMPADTAYLEVESPFSADQLQVRLAANLSTRWRDREASIPAIVKLIAAQHQAQPGNYLAFFGSYAFMRAAAQAFALAHPRIPAWCQQPGMSEAERSAFLDRFVDPMVINDQGAPLTVVHTGGVGFAVLGGAFAEGIDLPGQRLIGAFIATLGMPQVDPVNEAMRERLHTMFGDGHAYTYFYPGLRKVVQAAGRVIRTPQDRGSVYLLDDRFTKASARRLLPAWWQPTSITLD